MSAPTITEPGIYDLPEDVYFSDPVPGGSLSSTGARRLLPPSCPALFDYERRNGQGHKREFDLGHAAHMLVLGAGADLHVVDADNYQTKAARQERDEAYARNVIPLLPHDFDTVQAMAKALREHPRAADLFDAESGGVAEQSLFWTDHATGVMCRARLDWLSDKIVDYKTTTNVSPGHIAKSVESFGYHQQADFYLSGAIELDLIAPDAEFLFVFQDKNPPHLVTVVELDDTALRIGRERNERALRIYQQCTATGVWPAYTDDVETISLPAYAVRRHNEEIYS